MVSIKTFGYLTHYVENKNIGLFDAADGTTIKELLRILNIPESAVGFISVNGDMVSKDYQIAHGDQIKIFPVVMGG